MATTSELDRVAMVVLRFMRRPFFAIVGVYAVGITGMALIPGIDESGNPEHMSLFHAFYFFTYTATTTGFGEIPSAFTDEQRLWAIFCLYMGVIAWLYAVGSIIRLLQNPHFILALNEHRFAKIVKRLNDPFVLICGFGDTGSLLARGLSDQGMRAVIIDSDPERIKALALRDYSMRMPGLCADASVPKHLLDAGIKTAHCKAMVILFKDEDINLKIAIIAKFFNPSIQIICRSTSARHQAHLKALNNVTAINPFEIFAQLLNMAVTSPQLHNLNSWLVHAPGVSLGHPLKVPEGHWIVCGYGRMGKWLNKYFAEQGIHATIVDPHIEDTPENSKVIREHADHQTLLEADIENAAGVLAGTNHDGDNLGILMCVNALNPKAFTIVRQNDHENQLAFDAAHADLTLQSSLTTARRILKFLISPMIQTLIDDLHRSNPDQTTALISRLQAAIGEHSPQLWRINMCSEETSAVCEYFGSDLPLTLGDIIRDPHDLENTLPCVPLMIERNSSQLMLPESSQLLQDGDEILFCGTTQGKRMLLASMNNPYTLNYLLTGTDPPRSYFFSWLSTKLESHAI